jgi:hypothetical protein
MGSNSGWFTLGVAVLSAVLAFCGTLVVSAQAARAARGLERDKLAEATRKDREQAFLTALVAARRVRVSDLAELGAALDALQDAAALVACVPPTSMDHCPCSSPPPSGLPRSAAATRAPARW